MRREYSKPLRAEFLKLLRGLAPEFKASNVRSLWRMPGVQTFMAQSESIWSIVEIYPNPKGMQAFTIEFGWSRRQRYPEVVSSLYCDRQPNPERLRLDEYKERIAVFLGDDKWWYLEDEHNIKAHLDGRDIPDGDAMEKVQRVLAEIRPILEKELLPYLRRASERISNGRGFV